MGITTEGIVEVECTKGIGIHLIGVPDSAAKESLLRVITAIQSAGYHCPGKKIVIRVDLEGRPSRVDWSQFDLGIAIGILAESGQIELEQRAYLNDFFTGQLTLGGQVVAGSIGIYPIDAARIMDYRNTAEDTYIYGWAEDGLARWCGGTLGDIIEQVSR